jgi:hypothetical protein
MKSKSVINTTLGLFLLLATAANLSSGSRAFAGQTFDRTYKSYDALLKKYVKNGAVDYAGLKKEKALTDFMEEVRVLGKDEFKTWPEQERLVFWINLYNAATLDLVARNYPVKSIKNIVSYNAGQAEWKAGSTPWDIVFIRLFKDKITLNNIEHKILRKEFKEPRIHFAIVCASIGCPPLRAEAFVASKIDRQLTEQAKTFLADKSKNSFDGAAKKAAISNIFNWFSGDFEAEAGSVQKFLAKYADPAFKSDLEAEKFSISYTDYDWNLNKQ